MPFWGDMLVPWRVPVYMFFWFPVVVQEQNTLAFRDSIDNVGLGVPFENRFEMLKISNFHAPYFYGWQTANLKGKSLKAKVTKVPRIKS